MRVLLVAGAGDTQCRAEGNLYAAAQLADGQHFKSDRLVIDMLGDAVTRFQFIDFHNVFPAARGLLMARRPLRHGQASGWGDVLTKGVLPVQTGNVSRHRAGHAASGITMRRVLRGSHLGVARVRSGTVTVCLYRLCRKATGGRDIRAEAGVAAGKFAAIRNDERPRVGGLLA